MGTLIVIIVAYFIPSIVGFASDKRSAPGIFVLNIFTGWTLIGWVASLIWAVIPDKK
jgi:hypothetical protein